MDLNARTVNVYQLMFAIRTATAKEINTVTMEVSAFLPSPTNVANLPRFLQNVLTAIAVLISATINEQNVLTDVPLEGTLESAVTLVTSANGSSLNVLGAMETMIAPAGCTVSMGSARLLIHTTVNVTATEIANTENTVLLENV